MIKIKNVSDITTVMVETFEGLINGTIDVQNAKARASVAKVILTSCVVQMEYARMTDSKEPIKFLGTNIRRQNVLPPSGHEIVHPGPEPPKPEFSSLVMQALEEQPPMDELAVAARMIDMGLVHETYFAHDPMKPGGPYAVLRGTLLGKSRAGDITMGKNEQGRAVFSLTPAPDGH